MEHTRRTRRSSATGSRTGRNRKETFSAQERRRLVQLGASIGLFLLVFAGRGLFPAEMDRWQSVLAQNVDFRAAISGFAKSLSQGEPVLDTLGDLWVEVFAGGTVTVTIPQEAWDRTPTFARRMEEQLRAPGDAVSRWAQERRAEAEALRAAQGAAEEDAAGGGADAAATASAAWPEGEPLYARTALAVQPSQPLPTVTAVAQSVDQEGRALPASVSMERYPLGLERTVTPVVAALTSDYGYRDHPVSGNRAFHRGVDLGAPTGTEILAFADGTVAYTGENDVCGLYLRIDHSNGVATFYCHCSAVGVSAGQAVSAGEAVARVGETGNATGPHLHFALLKDEVYLDPLYYIEVG